MHEDYKGQEFLGEMQGHKWASEKDIKAMKNNQFAEYYYKKMLSDYLKGNKKGFPIESIESLNYIKIQKTKSYRDWFKKIINKNYNPNEIKDFIKLKKKNKK